MKILGIVAEYNPFHSGHKYQLNKAMQLSNCDASAVVMSGNFVQRGEPAIIEKYKRAEIAVKNGVDLVIELPLPFSCQNAELFALGAVRELKKLNVSTISFGCENTDIKLLNKIANIQLNNHDEYNKLLKDNINDGLSYPLAVNHTLNKLLNKNLTDELLLSPNNTLGLEYIKACKKTGFNVDFLPIKRHTAQHNDVIIHNNIASATAIRNEILSSRISRTKTALPDSSYIAIKNYYSEHKRFNCLDNYLDMIYYKILTAGAKKLKDIYEITEGLENKIYNNAICCDRLNEFILSIKSKRYTYSRIRRILLNILIDITSDDIKYFVENEHNYIKVLAFNDNGKKILSNAKKNDISIITKFSDYIRNNIDISKDRLFELTNRSSNIYYLPFAHDKKYLNTEYKKSVTFLN